MLTYTHPHPHPLEPFFLAVTRRHRGDFGKFLAHWNRVRVRVAQLSYNGDFRWFGLLRPQFTIFWVLGVWGTFAATFGARNGPKTPESGFSRSWGPFWAKRQVTKYDRMLNADPLNPVWAPMCPWGPRYECSGGAWGPFRRLGTGCVGSGPNRQNPVSAATRRHREVLAHRNRARVAQLSYSDNVGWFYPSFREIRELLVFGGLGDLEECRGHPGHSGRNSREPNLIAC